MKKKASKILEKLREYILSNELESSCKSEISAFTRKRILSFQATILHIIHLLKTSLQVSISKLASSLSIPIVSKQAFCLARKKILPEAFIKINNKLCSEFYSDNTFKTFCGFILFAVDGSTIQLPDSSEIREKYNVAKNQLGETSISLGRISCSYDVLNGITVDSILEKCNVGERELAVRHLQNSSDLLKDKSTLYMYDRGYVSLTIMFYHLHHKQNFLMRSTLKFLPTDVQNRIKDGEVDFIIDINARKIKGAKKTAEFRKLLPNTPFNSKISVRIIVIALETGEKEILITSLLDSKYKCEMFKSLYHFRWGAEENYKFQKLRIEIENFSGKSDLVVRQDFHSTVLASNIRSVVALEAQSELDEEKDWSKCKYTYKINQNVAMGVLREEIVNALVDPQKKLNLFCIKLKEIMKKNTVPIRSDRAFPHIIKTNGRKYHLTQRRCI